jgi:hypothetical protein
MTLQATAGGSGMALGQALGYPGCYVACDISCCACLSGDSPRQWLGGQSRSQQHSRGGRPHAASQRLYRSGVRGVTLLCVTSPITGPQDDNKGGQCDHSRYYCAGDQSAVLQLGACSALLQLRARSAVSVGRAGRPPWHQIAASHWLMLRWLTWGPKWRRAHPFPCHPCRS